MSVANVTEITATSKLSFEDAIKQGIETANRKLRNVKGAWISDQKLDIDNGQIYQYRVLMKVTYILDD